MASQAEKLQKLANASAEKIQKLVNSANTAALKFNSKEAKIARDFNAKEAATARAYNSKEAQLSRDWQTQMSNTAHQREVKDLVKAGLNPVLSANSGAQSYTTSSASASNASASNASGSVESGAGAIGSLLSGMMSGIVGLQQTQMSANAQMKAAKLTSDATRFAAQESASASRYAAQQNAAASKYASDMAYKTQMEKPQSGIVGVLDKYFGKKAKGYLSGSEKVADRVSQPAFRQSDGKWLSVSWNPNMPARDKNQIHKELIKYGFSRQYLDTLSRDKLNSLYGTFCQAFNSKVTLRARQSALKELSRLKR